MPIEWGLSAYLSPELGRHRLWRAVSGFFAPEGYRREAGARDRRRTNLALVLQLGPHFNVAAQLGEQIVNVERLVQAVLRAQVSHSAVDAGVGPAG